VYELENLNFLDGIIIMQLENDCISGLFDPSQLEYGRDLAVNLFRASIEF